MPLKGLFRSRRARVAAALCFSLAAIESVEAQQSRVTMLDISTGSEMEDYLRVMQVAGKVPLYPWSIRGFSPTEARSLATADSAGPWALNHRYKSSLIDAGPLTLATTFNSAYPYGANDGAVWAGRGLTLQASAGVSGRYGPLSFSLAPVAFRASNTSFPLLSNGKSGLKAFNRGTFADVVDMPQRFGDGAYSRVDPGNSGIRLDTRFVTAGLATGNQWIGPATEYPFLIGTNAPGFPHLFVGTGAPINLWVARAHARVMWGKLYQSEYGPVTGGTRFTGIETGTERLTTSVTLVILPRGIPGLELGFGRYFHVPNQLGEPSGKFWSKPFKEFFFKNEQAQGDTAGLDNQLAALFFRWTFPESGFEVYGERGYEDQFYDLREFIQSMDHEREYMLGFQKTIPARGRVIHVVKGELINYQVPTLARLRIENAVYLHSPLQQGHTNRGQLLGASPGVGAAAASSISWTRYAPSGRTAVMFHRILRDEQGDYLGKFVRNGDYNPFPTGAGIPPHKLTDVLVSLGVERMQFTKYGDFGAKLEAMQNYNRNFSSNVANLNLQMMARLRLL